MEKLFGYEHEELIGRSVEVLVPSELHAAHVGDRATYAANPQMRAMGPGRDLRAVRKDGTEFPVEIGLSPIRTEDALLIAAHITDISARKQAEEALRKAHEDLEGRELRATNDRLGKLSSRILKLQDEERRRIGQELHDSTAQSLAGVAMNLAVVQQLGKGLSARAQRALAETATLVDQCAREIRTLSYLFHPPLLDEVGLPSAVQWYADGFAKRSGISIRVDTSPQIGRLSQEAETALFRIVQECLSNVHRHAGASTAHIQIVRAGDAITLKVEDGGRGIAAEALKGLGDAEAQLGVGIMGMRERMRQLGGQLDIHSSHAGTVVIATLPLAASFRLPDANSECP
jgi:PAS domain S-box-containing protein